MKMCKVYAIASQKGGVGKTTTAANFGIELAREGYKVLLIDADAQGSLTASLGYTEPDRLDETFAMDEIAEKLGGDFIVLPSSVHETIVLPINEDMDPKELEGMVQQINAGVVSDEDKLSDHVFQYDSESHELVRMDKMEERKHEKEASVEKNDKSQEDRSEKKAEAKTAVKEEKGQKSLKDRISNKQEEVAKKEATREPAAQKSKKMAIG